MAAIAGAPASSTPKPKRSHSRGGIFGQVALLLGCAVFFVTPLLAMARFALQNVPMIRLGSSTLFENWSLSGVTRSFSEPGFGDSFWLSLQLAFGTVLATLALLLPTTLWVHLRIPKARTLVEFLTILPYVIPPIALVAGILPLKPYARWFLNSPLSLIPFYVVLALPFTFRALDAGIRAIPLRTLVDASRSLGAGWGQTMLRVLLPNLRASIVSASFLTAAVVLGEYTVASVLLKRTLPQFMAEYQQREPQGGMGLALLSLLATTLLFVVLGLVTRPSRSVRRARAGLAPNVAPTS